MGYLPIILAIAGFIFLWGLVNFNSIKSKMKEAEEATALVFRYAALRNAILRQMNLIADVDPTIHTVIEQVQPHLNEQSREEISVQKKLAVEKEITELVDRIPTVAADQKNYQNIYKQLLVADNKYRKAATLYRVRIKQYNELVTRNPSKLLATILGYKPVETLENTIS